MIESQTEYVVFYSPQDLQKAGKVTVNVKGATVQQFLNLCLANQPFTFSVDDRSIGLEYDPSIILVGKEIPRAPFKMVKGIVVDSARNPIAGATISVTGTHKTFSASKTGGFKISVPGRTREIEISAINYNLTSLFIKAGDVDFGKIILGPKPVVQEQPTIVIGYGSQKKSDITGSISVVNKKEIGDRTGREIIGLLAGKIPGVDVSGSAIRIRGTTSFNFTEPLIVIDGFLGGSLSNVNPNDVMNMEVLKDASSTAIYGARGANGVIVITTKSGKSGEVKCNINSFAGFATTPRRLQVLNAEQYVQFVGEGLTNAGLGIPDKLKSDYVRVTRTNWQDEVF
ncbi:MAG: TonB-dependent receptor plug domain-containing protein, partial [Chitinophagaceae bacterium]